MYRAFNNLSCPLISIEEEIRRRIESQEQRRKSDLSNVRNWENIVTRISKTWKEEPFAWRIDDIEVVKDNLRNICKFVLIMPDDITSYLGVSNKLGFQIVCYDGAQNISSNFSYSAAAFDLTTSSQSDFLLSYIVDAVNFLVSQSDN